MDNLNLDSDSQTFSDDSFDSSSEHSDDDNVFSTSLENINVELPDSDIMDTISDVSDFFIPESNLELPNIDDSFNSMFGNSGLSDAAENLRGTVSDTLDNFRDTMDFDIPDIESSLDHVGSLVTDVASSFEDRPAPDFSSNDNFQFDFDSFETGSNRNNDWASTDSESSMFGDSEESEMFGNENSDFGGGESSWTDA